MVSLKSDYKNWLKYGIDTLDWIKFHYRDLKLLLDYLEPSEIKDVFKLNKNQLTEDKLKELVDVEKQDSDLNLLVICKALVAKNELTSDLLQDLKIIYPEIEEKKSLLYFIYSEYKRNPRKFWDFINKLVTLSLYKNAFRKDYLIRWIDFKGNPNTLFKRLDDSLKVDKYISKRKDQRSHKEKDKHIFFDKFNFKDRYLYVIDKEKEDIINEEEFEPKRKGSYLAYPLERNVIAINENFDELSYPKQEISKPVCEKLLKRVGFEYELKHKTDVQFEGITEIERKEMFDAFSENIEQNKVDKYKKPVSIVFINDPIAKNYNIDKHKEFNIFRINAKFVQDDPKSSDYTLTNPINVMDSIINLKKLGIDLLKSDKVVFKIKIGEQEFDFNLDSGLTIKKTVAFSEKEYKNFNKKIKKAIMDYFK